VIVPIYLVLAFGGAIFCYIIIGKDLLPKTNTGQLQLRLREPDGTRLEVTEKTTKGVLAVIDSAVHGHIAISSAYVGLVPSSFGSSNLYIFNSGTHESVIQVNLDEDYKVQDRRPEGRIRKNILAKYPELRISFEPIELTDKIMAQGANTPIEVRVAGKNMEDIKATPPRLLARCDRSLSCGTFRSPSP
jgi:multidrug efflux pump subunit AcrB